MSKNKYKNKKINLEISSTSFDGEPETSFDLINKYGTYEIQPTSDMQNKFPTIAQGLSQYDDKPTVKSKANNYGEDNKPYKKH